MCALGRENPGQRPPWGCSLHPVSSWDLPVLQGREGLTSSSLGPWVCWEAWGCRVTWPHPGHSLGPWACGKCRDLEGLGPVLGLWVCGNCGDAVTRPHPGCSVQLCGPASSTCLWLVCFGCGQRSIFPRVPHMLLRLCCLPMAGTVIGVSQGPEASQLFPLPPGAFVPNATHS